MSDLKSWWDLDLFSKPCGDRHWISLVATIKSKSKMGTTSGGTSHGLIR
jgi:hypothetical protein